MILLIKNNCIIIKKVSEYDQEKIYNHTLQTNPQHGEEVPENIYSNNTSLKQ